MHQALALFRGLRPVALLTIALTAALACGNTSSPSAPGGAKTGGKVVVASWQEPDTLLANGVTDSMTHAVADDGFTQEGLLGFTPLEDVPKNPKQSDYFTPQLASEIPTTDNGDVKINNGKMSVTYKLRHNVKWQDGQDFSADDVVDTANFWWLKFKDNNPTPVVSTTGWDQIESVQKVDTYTVTVNYKAVYGPYMSLFGGVGGVLPSHLLQKTWSDPTAKGDMTKAKLSIDLTPSNSNAFKGTDTWDKWEVGTGPFTFKEWVSGDHMTLVRNNLYWGPHKAYLDQITIKFEPDANTELADLRTGTIDYGWDFRAALISPLTHINNVTAKIFPTSGAEHLDVNLHNKYLSDPTIRKAILMGIDRQKMVDTLLEGKTTIPPDSWLCIETGAWCSDPSVPKTKFDPSAANQLLENAGYKKATSGADKGYRQFKDGTTIAINAGTTTLPLRSQQLVQIQSDLQTIGIKVNSPFQIYPAGKFFGAYASGGIIYHHNFDLAQYTNSYGSPAEPDSFYSGYVSTEVPTDANNGNGQNTTFCNDPKIDQAFKDGRNQAGQSQRKAAYVQAQVALANDLCDIPLYLFVQVNGYSTKLGGVKNNEFIWSVASQDWYLTS